MSLLGLPAQKLSENGLANIPKGLTALICHSSFEPRAEAILKFNLKDIDLHIACILATKESMATTAYKERTKTLLEYFKVNATVNPKLICENRTERMSWIKSLHDFFSSTDCALIGSVLIDVSVFPRDRMWFLLDYVKKSRPEIRIFLIYTEPGRYDTEVSNEGWLTRGVRSISPIPGFNGFQNTGKKSLLVLIVGHEYERAHITIKNTEPQKVVLLGQGIEQYRNDSPRLSDEVMRQIGTEFESVVDLSFAAEINSRDYLSTQNTVEEIVEKYSSKYNISIATYGTKLQSLGAFLACKKHQKIRAIYAEPQRYNVTSYSIDSGASWLLEV